MTPPVHFLWREDHRLACSATAPERARTTEKPAEVTCRNCQRALAAIRWWEPPSDEDAREGMELLALASDEIDALVSFCDGERWIHQQLLERGGLSTDERQRHERFLSYYQARIRQLKMLDAETHAGPREFVAP